MGKFKHALQWVLVKLKLVKPTLYWIYYGGDWEEFFGKREPRK